MVKFCFTLRSLSTISKSIIMFLSFFQITSFMTGYAIPISEFDALEQLFFSTNGPNWDIGSGTPWNFSSSADQNPCNYPLWYGITCGFAGENGNISVVVRLDLTSSNLNGTIPPSIMNLTSLTSLLLGYNHIFGSIPAEIGNMTYLQNLNMSNNDLTNTIPSELSQLSSLQLLDLSSNVLGKYIPDTIGQMTSLIGLFLNNNLLSGTIPSSIGLLSFLEQLYLYTNQLTGQIPASIGQLSQLSALTMDNNLLSGAIPSELGLLSQLSYLSINENYLSGHLSPTLFNCTSLTYLSIYGNKLSGSIPSEVNQLLNVQSLGLCDNQFSGTMPPMTNLSQMTTVYMYENILTGTISPEWGTLDGLQGLFIDSNYFTSTLPPQLGSMSGLVGIYVEGNLLSGSIPAELGNLLLLEEFQVYDNLLNGTLPAEMSNCPYLFVFAASFNELSGSLPESYSNLEYMQVFYLSDNYLTGSIPSALSNWSYMFEFSLNNNKLTGSLSPDFSHWSTYLINFYVYENLLTGTLPDSYCSLTTLSGFYVYENMLSGSIPECIGNMAAFQYMSFESNTFTGSIPASVGNLSNLVYFGVEKNFLTSPIPDSIGQLSLLEELAIQVNQLTGALPSSMGQMSDLVSLILFSNLLTGTLPEEYGNFKHMTSFIVSENLLSGTVPPQFSEIVHLDTLYLQDNLLSGSLTAVFNASLQQGVTYVGLAYNQFTGSIPANVFQIPSLQEFEIVSTCLSGSIPIEICGAPVLTSLLLDGISTGSSCQRKIFPNIAGSTSFFATKRVSGSIPACLFNMSALQIMHLSGNSITGSLPSDLIVSSTLNELVLSHNQLSGSIPLAIQQRHWELLDLSFNKLSGVLDESYATVNSNASVSLQVNCLSGNIPSALRDAESVSLVSGNMFYCEIGDRSALPAHDTASDNYQCGSNSLNLSMYLFGACIIAIVALVLIVMLVRAKYKDISIFANGIIANYHIWSATLDNLPTDSSLYQCIHMLSYFRTTVLLTTSMLLLVFLPVYCILSVYFSTYTHAYAWTTSAAFLAGETTGIVLFVLWMAVVVALVCSEWWCTHAVAMSTLTTTSVLTWRSELAVGLVLLVNFVAVVGMNVLYVWVVINANTQAGITATEVSLAAFKLLWNDAIIPRLFLLAKAGDFRRYTVLRVCILLFNNIIAPCAATAAVSPDCFYYAVTTPQSVATDTTINVCTSIVISGNSPQCTATNTETLTYTYLPPFIYSFQCSSNLITNYASIFVYMYLIDAFVKPLYLLALNYTHSHWQSLAPITSVLLPNILKSPQSSHLNVPNRPLLNRDAIVLSVVNTSAILLSFGVVFPLLSAVIAVNVMIGTRITQLSVGRVLTLAGTDRVLLMQYLGVLDKECAEVGVHITKSLWLIVPVVAVFYSIFLFDIFGFKAGWRFAIWAPAVTILLPLIAKSVQIAFRLYGPAGGDKSSSVVNHNNSTRESTVEMSGVQNPIQRMVTIRGSEVC